MYVVICYDVVKDRRRTKLHRRLKAWLVPVQKSVFEGEVKPWLWGEVERAIEEEIDPATDTVRVYQLCRGCRPLMQRYGIAVQVDGVERDVIV
jgi:CRISPR-associated protein Cas2